MKIYIVGAGFAGLEAAKKLSRKLSGSNEIYLIDKNSYTTMLPNLPEITGGRLNPEDITEDIRTLLPSSVKFLNEEVFKIDLDEKVIITTLKNPNNFREHKYDYLILASGSKTNFYGFDQNLDKINILDSLKTAEDIHVNFKKYLTETKEPTLVVSGAGFTGIELACNLYDLSKKREKNLKVIFVEVAPKILPMLSERLTLHVTDKLNELNFKVYTDNKVESFDGKNITLKDKQIIEEVFFCWCSGVKSSLDPDGDYDTIPDGRIIVNEFLSIPNYPEVYVAGDAAAIKDKNGKFLRRAITFAKMSGNHVGKNLAAELNNRKQKPFKYIDMGWIIPIYISSIGVALGMEIKGRKGIFMHYVLCGIYNFNLRNFIHELKAAFKFIFTKP